MRKIIQIESQGGLPLVVKRAQGGNWVATCEPLALTIQSETWAMLMEDIAQTLNALFIDLLEDGELERFLSDRGFRVVGALPPEREDLWFDVPFNPLMASQVDSPRSFHQ
jgi:hypothetical protein